jgi:hypothetical protein
MKVEVDIDIKDIKEAVAKVIARKIYDENATTRLFGFKDHVKEAIKKEADKMLTEMPETQKLMKKLLSDEKFIKECIKETMKDEAENVLRELKDR